MPTAAELNADRYLVIQNYPDSPYEEGDVIDTTFPSFDDGTTGVADYPKIFRKKYWYEDVAEVDLPLRVKNLRTEEYLDIEPGSYNFTALPTLPFALTTTGDTVWLQFTEAADPGSGT